MWDPYAQFESAVLSNGLIVHCFHWPQCSGVHLGFGIHSGARHDAPGKEGSAHYMEHLVHCNGGSSAEELKDFFDRNTGHRANLGTTSFYSTWYSCHSSVEERLLSQSLEFFGNMLLHGKIERYMERERAVIEGEYRRKYPFDVLHELTERMFRTVFPNTFFTRMSSPLGTLETIRSMTEGDLQSFYDAHYTPQNMEIVAVGELPLKDLVRFLERSPFSMQKSGERTELLEPLDETPYPTDRIELFKLGEYIQGLSSAEYHSLAQLSNAYSSSQIDLFGSMLSERLFTEIRQERSWAYGVSCNYQSFGGDFGWFRIQCPGLQLDAVPSIEAVVTECINTLSEQRSLFDQCKAKGIASKRFLDQNGSAIAEGALRDLLLKDRIIPLAEELSDLEQSTLEDVALIANRLATERRFTSIRIP